ncbi:PH domain-containing protein [Hymenobacter sp. B1770]|uniref:PH domain-containing protein n=1 Tax=Hymenobacter sp. B1770 TaxID=1718788 RepID=UPI003CFB2364
MGFFSALMGNAGVAQPSELNKEYGVLLAEGEVIEIGFKLVRDVFVFTNKRLILVEKQGLTGKKVDYLSIAYKSISRFGIETAGHLDLDAELKIWVSSEVQPSIVRKFNNQVNIYDLQRVLAQHVLG